MRSLACAVALLAPLAACAADPLPSWREGATRIAGLDFVAAAADPASAGFVPEAERIAVFDNDGTLLAAQPVCFQLIFAMDQAAARAAAEPGWAATPALATAGAGDLAGVMAGGDRRGGGPRRGRPAHRGARNDRRLRRRVGPAMGGCRPRRVAARRQVHDCGRRASSVP